jgi:hypothetical protein
MLVIEWLGGNCPVQAEGTINGQPFYFRARGQHWSIGVGGEDTVSNPKWLREEEWGDGPFAAGCMPHDEARSIIERCAEEYSRQAPSD